MTEPEIRLVYDAQTIQNQVAALGRRLEDDHADEDPLIVSIVGGSVVFLADLVRAIRRPIRYEFIQVHYSASDLAGNVMEIHYPISLDVSGQSLVILKDVVTTGVIENYLTSQFVERGAARVLFAALIDLPEQRRSDLRADYRVFTPKKPGLFVGYGLKMRGRYGNLPYIGRLADASGNPGAPRTVSTSERGTPA